MVDALPSTAMNDERDNRTGKFTRKYSDGDFVDAVEDLGPLAASSDIASEVGCNHITANERLRELEDEGCVEGLRRAGAVLWTAVDEDRNYHEKDDQ
jgi:hypothetical protein